MRYLRRCIYCSSPFQSDEKRRLFCSDPCKTRYNRDTAYVCFYCGDTSSTRDHITPHSTSYFPVRQWKDLDYVNCCQECNSILGNRDPYSMSSRVGRLVDRFTKLKGLGKGVVQWDEDELEELGHELRRQIRAAQEARDRNEGRLAHMKTRLGAILEAEEEALGEALPVGANDNEEEYWSAMGGRPNSR